MLIADDEPAARIELKRVIASFPELELVAECENGVSASAAIAEHEPDIVFLDIDMPELDGFGVAESTRDLPYHLVFLTAHHRFALRAFDTDAIDFLLKPARPSLIERCIEKILRRERAVLERASAEVSGKRQLVFADSGVSRVVDVSHILLIGALGRYRRLFLTEEGAQVHRQSTLISNTTLDEFMVELDSQWFMRVHRSCIVNMSKVVALHSRARRHFLSLEGGGDEIPVSRNQVKPVREWLDRFSSEGYSVFD